MINFELSPVAKKGKKLYREFNENVIRKLSPYYDSYEHEHDGIKEAEEIRKGHLEIQKKMAGFQIQQSPSDGPVTGMVIAEENAWGDPGIGLGASRGGLGNAAIASVATDEQKKRFAGKYASMAITEPCCGSDTASIQATARLDEETNEWVLNGEKIFVTGGYHSELVVAWASLDRTLGRAAIKSFVVEKDRPGITVSKLEHKLGIRASDTASIVLEDCRVPFENILGDPEIKQKKTSKSGFQGVMRTFDATRPAVAAQALGIGQAAFDFTKEKLEEEGFTFPYNRGLHELSALQREMLEMEAHLDVSRLLIWSSVAMLATGQRNSLEASIGKAKAGRASTLVTQKCVAMLGPLGYSREWLLEKFMRDVKITDIFEGTGQIQTLIVARNILGFNRDMLK
ncbi:MAG: acyl-CoA dehydrogenase family protein [Deltaproteobacteria bacterium]|nr:acyl-CoA dehydrogenase family protein [Deltaproteobacteria bacterium]